ncbi:MAG: DNA polymerase III subunit epsilon [Gammaproteobacteria bacterium]|nr:MAG: DNA polymerase III subunit epsilon [Gammaproteobacteria bacterium]
MRQVVLDTETTGLEPELGHRVIEIGCVEIIGRRITDRKFHTYINPERDVDEGAVEVHGLTRERLETEPKFADVVEAFVDFIRGAEVIIHNAPFDVGFLEHEFALLTSSPGCMVDLCEVVDSLTLARRRHPGQRNSLDALCRRYGIDNSQRELHGALLDAEILAEVYLVMTGGQTDLSLDAETSPSRADEQAIVMRLPADRPQLRVLRANDEELARHEQLLDVMAKHGGVVPLWRAIGSVAES